MWIYSVSVISVYFQFVEISCNVLFWNNLAAVGWRLIIPLLCNSWTVIIPVVSVLQILTTYRFPAARTIVFYGKQSYRHRADKRTNEEKKDKRNTKDCVVNIRP